MSVIVRQFMPGEFARFEPWQGMVDTQAELLALPFVRPWEKAPGFVRFSLSRADQRFPFHNELMAELNRSKDFVVLASVRGWPNDEAIVDLPDWTRPFVQEQIALATQHDQLLYRGHRYLK
jgi:hypothetical protein